MAYRVGLKLCRNNLLEILITNKGNISMKASKLLDKLLKSWILINNWDLTPLRLGYFEFSFKSREDLNKI